MRNKDIIAYLDLWEKLNNENFKGVEFGTFKNDAGKMLITYLYKYHLSDIKTYGNKPITYVKFLRMIGNGNLGIIYDMYANKNNKRTIIDKLHAFRNVQLIRYLKDFDISAQEISETGMGCGMGNQDMILVYSKNCR